MVAIDYNISLLHHDPDYDLIAKHSELRISHLGCSGKSCGARASQYPPCYKSMLKFKAFRERFLGYMPLLDVETSPPSRQGEEAVEGHPLKIRMNQNMNEDRSKLFKLRQNLLGFFRSRKFRVQF
jgi:hypothetical protein